MASTRVLGRQQESPYSEGPGSSNFSTVAPLKTAGCSADMVTGATQSLQRRQPPSQPADMDTDEETVVPAETEGQHIRNHPT